MKEVQEGERFHTIGAYIKLVDGKFVVEQLEKDSTNRDNGKPADLTIYQGRWCIFNED